MIRNRRKFYTGIALLAGFMVILGILFSPIFGGHNGLNFLDSLYNSISKGSAYYLPEVTEKTAAYVETDISVSLELAEEMTAQAEIIFERSGADAAVFDGGLTVSGDLGVIFQSCLADAESMYQNDGSAVREKYGMEEKQALYTWHSAFTAMEKDLNRQKRFKEAKMVGSVVDKAVDLSYNYYGIDAARISDSPWVVVFSLLFYVIYTLWFGFAILFLFEGVGMQLEH